jgi:hypothetical protein
LDYPGEPDFIQALSGELRDDPFVVSYNGKSFDSQILKTRCLMNGMRVPLYRHADLLHPARRLWKRVLSGCAQGTVEAEILGIDRRGDTPGALAPEIWFSFLKTGGTEALVGVCDHNRRDIAGLAAILAVMIAIAADPIRSLRDFTFDVEQLALRWRDFSHHSTPHRGTPYHELRDRGAELLRFAAEKGYPRAALVHALDLFRGGGYDEGRGRLLTVAESGVPVNIQAAALRSLAIDSERRLMDAPEALRLTRRALELLPEGTARRGEFERRAERLAQKTGLSR